MSEQDGKYARSTCGHQESRTCITTSIYNRATGGSQPSHLCSHKPTLSGVDGPFTLFPLPDLPSISKHSAQLPVRLTPRHFSGPPFTPFILSSGTFCHEWRSNQLRRGVHCLSAPTPACPNTLPLLLPVSPPPRSTSRGTAYLLQHELHIDPAACIA